MSGRAELVPVEGLPEVEPGDALGDLIARAVANGGTTLADDDVVVVSQKIVSKAEGRVVELADVDPGERAIELAERLGKDPRVVELVLRESADVVRAERGVLIVEGRAGWISANAGIDASNVPGEERVTLLPEDSDASARRLRAELRDVAGAAPAVVIADSFGRPWRIGQTDVAIGCAGLTAGGRLAGAPGRPWDRVDRDRDRSGGRGGGSGRSRPSQGRGRSGDDRSRARPVRHRRRRTWRGRPPAAA